MTSAAAVRHQALAKASAGDDAGAARLFADGVRSFPGDAAFANSAGSFHAGAGRPVEALALFDRALAIQPTLHEAAINRAVVLPRLDRAGEAAAMLRERQSILATMPRYWSTRAAAEFAAGDIAGAAVSYDAALARDPGNVRALHGRARTALERGESRAIDDHERALAMSPGDPALLLGYANALQAGGRQDEALDISQALVTHLPGWVDGLELHAGLRWARGEGPGFVDHYRAALDAAGTVTVARSWAAMLAGVDRHAEAVAVLTVARHHWPDDPGIALDEAVAAGEAGDDDHATAMFAHHRRAEPDWYTAEARHLLRRGDPAAAEALLARTLATSPDDVAAWGLRDLCWRLLGDHRHAWLHGQPGLIRSIDLDLSTAELDHARVMLDRLHDRSAMPVGQSVKHGSQTRGALFRRTEPEIAVVAGAIGRAIDVYRDGLPPTDVTHPLLRHRDAPWRIAGSWSIRLDGVGHHAAHIHPQGIVSSAAYFTVPGVISDTTRPGWLELGRPPSVLRVDLPPIATIAPREGQCALFPSTLFHGTRPITAGRRMTVAFDVATSS